MAMQSSCPASLLWAALCLHCLPVSLALMPRLELWPSPQFWPINRQFPGLRALSEDPAIFVVDDLLDKETCEKLIAKAAPHMCQSLVQTSEGYVPNEARTSSDGTVDWSEVPSIHGIFSELLNMPASHFEPLKVSRYEPGQCFKLHNDGLPGGSEAGLPICAAPFCNRVVTLFVYLCDCSDGGATVFPMLGPSGEMRDPEALGGGPALSIQPKRGMGVIHFPSEMPLHGGLRDERVCHEGAAAVSEKWICQQWGWTGPLIREALPDSMLGQRWDDVLL